jgi:multisubunit Na+/H+ antiporter MnhF subunit
VIADIAVAVFLLAGALAGVRLVRGPDLADRVISLDAALVALMGAIATRVAETGDTLYIGILVVIAIVAFTATVVLSRFVETTGRSS